MFCGSYGLVFLLGGSIGGFVGGLIGLPLITDSTWMACFFFERLAVEACLVLDFPARK